MGRIKSLQTSDAGIHNLFSVRYRRLVDDNNTANNNNVHHNQQINNAQLVVQNLIRMKLSQDYIAYCCGQCGHHQRFDIKADELQSFGEALRNGSWNASSTEAPATLVISAADAKSVNVPTPPAKNTSWTRQFHDKSKKANNIQKSALVEPERNLKEMNKCKCSKDAAKTLIKGTGPNGGTGTALVMPFHAHHPFMMGYKPLLSSLDLTGSSSTPVKPQNICKSSSCNTSRSASPSSSSDSYLPTLPVRSDSLTNLEEEALLKCAPWFQAGIPREISLEILQQEPVGSFLVRESTSKPGCYALSVRVPKDSQKSAIAHYLITQSNRGYKIKGFTKEFPSLTSLIVHHSVMPELLPCPLLLHRPSTGLLADYLDNANNFVDIDSSVLLELTRKCAE